MAQADYVDYDLLDEPGKVERNRYLEALAAGMSADAARVFAIDTHLDVALLRRLVRRGATGDEITRILL